MKKRDRKPAAIKCPDCGCWFIHPRGVKCGPCEPCQAQRDFTHALHNRRERLTADEEQEYYERSITHRVGTH